MQHTVIPSPDHARPPEVPVTPADQFAHRRGEPRTFIALWVVLLLASIAVTLGGVGMLGLLATDVYRPAARRLLIMIMVGSIVLWPMLRLSQIAPRRPARAFVVDALAVLVPIQAIIWPQSFPWMAAWPWEVSACVALWFAAWAVAIAGMLTWFFSGRRPACAPWALMVFFVSLAMGGVVAAAARPATDLDAEGLRTFDGWMMVSPVTGVWELTEDRAWTGLAAQVTSGHWWAVGWAWTFALVCWVLARSRAGQA
ncbi:MAG: hypothetical protein U0637_14995 [Phycisphaerales bacterium]